MTHSRIIFYLKGNESILLEAITGSKKDTVQVSYLESGIPRYRGFLYPTVLKHFEAGNWVIVTQQSLVA